jgi:DNA-binding NarL/FixJ family response regulator
MAELKILIADDHELIRRGLRALLGAQFGWRVVGEARNGVDAVEQAARLRPDVAILDFSMPGLTGPGAAMEIADRSPETSVLILTMHDSEDVVREVLQAGALGLVLKSDADRDLLEAVRAVANKQHFFAAHLAALVLSRDAAENRIWANHGRRPAGQLTEREREVMQLLAKGMTSKEAAALLRISIRTVESHRVNISRKLGFGSVADLVRYAIRHGIVAYS